jgi:hypothetical protein
VSQLFSIKVDPKEILEEYRTTRYPDRFYNLKIGIPWADLERRLDVQTVLALCRDGELPKGFNVMGVDTGKRLHVVILQTTQYEHWPGHLVHLQICDEFEELDELMKRFRIHRCVVDGLPETHATRDFAKRHDEIYLNFFVESQRGSAKYHKKDQRVDINRTEALDFSRRLIRDQKVTLLPRSREMEEFARHMACDAKVLEDNEETGAKKYRYIRTGENHYSMAFTYAAMALESTDMPMSPAMIAHIQRVIQNP